VALFPSKNLVQSQKAYRLINTLKIALPIGTLVLPAGRRRPALSSKPSPN
jgi:hypothetical protein